MLLGGYEVKKCHFRFFPSFAGFCCIFFCFFSPAALSQEALCRCLSHADAFEARGEYCAFSRKNEHHARTRVRLPGKWKRMTGSTAFSHFSR